MGGGWIRDRVDVFGALVAFANSVRPGNLARILIGERDDGTPEDLDPDAVQKTVRKEADKIYAPIIRRSAVYGRDSKVEGVPSTRARRLGASRRFA